MKISLFEICGITEYIEISTMMEHIGELAFDYAVRAESDRH